MARKLRLEYPGAIDHLMNRGDRREAIFKDDADRRAFLRTLGEACAQTDLAAARGSRALKPGRHGFEAKNSSDAD